MNNTTLTDAHYLGEWHRVPDIDLTSLLVSPDEPTAAQADAEWRRRYVSARRGCMLPVPDEMREPKDVEKDKLRKRLREINGQIDDLHAHISELENERSRVEAQISKL